MESIQTKHTIRITLFEYGHLNVKKPSPLATNELMNPTHEIRRRKARYFLSGMISTSLLLVLLMATLLLGSCGSSDPEPTPTPTKTPMPGVIDPTATPVSDSGIENPTPVPPTATAVTEAQPEATADTPVENTPIPAEDTPVPVVEEPTATPKPIPTLAAGMRSPDFAAQAFLWWREETSDRDLGLLKDGGFNWVKQWFAWQDIEGAGRGQYDWSIADRVVQQVEANGLKLLVRVSPTDDHGAWMGGPPENADLFAEFVGTMAQRYKGRIHAYQIWNEPNLSREWGDKPVDPAGYVQLLRKSYQAIKNADPNALVITAGMAPTTADQADAMYDEKFYRQMYEAMGGNSNGYFDLLGVHGAGYAVSPETDPGTIASNPKLYNNDPSAPERLRVYSFRHVEDIRRIMEEYGDSAKKVAIVEFGWTWDDRPSSPYYWHGAGAGIDPFVQSDYLVRAYKWAEQNWSWIGIMSLIFMPDSEWTPDTEQYYWSIMDPSPPGQTFWRPAYIELCIYLNGVQGTVCKYDPNQ